MKFHCQNTHSRSLMFHVLLQIELALDVEVALPYFMQKWSRFIIRHQVLYPNRQGFVVFQFLRELLEGNYMSKEAVIDKVLGNVLVSAK